MQVEGIDDRSILLAKHIIETKDTVRKTAKLFGISKSTVHKDVTERLERINKSLYLEVQKVLEQNKRERHIRGGIATREKYKARALS
ncbi:sporulation transcriptional regulator SpoIIID [Paludicola sp. MB14-C6]|uniref:sporulation transcriptional regulator SpoIIID n=1 Tax=Paludihabitans sp. MB14-C6 TaxID=3070656 RepID=UPI0027DAD18B|nr:sporulation transcriptional regulator SpoIIID [Paludicola sp. MB14-C6]WMJ23884.1 sporulation transcriptional regulator SpoIIID [Paludicola sp. MB14-C6]